MYEGQGVPASSRKSEGGGVLLLLPGASLKERTRAFRPVVANPWLVAALSGMVPAEPALALELGLGLG